MVAAQNGRGVGSSPLTRGKRVPPQGHGEAEGLIPAHAGKTPRWCPRPRGARVHPRSRRENCMASARVNFSSGSSPLTRGKLATLGYSTAWRGLIPAHAGKTLWRAGRCSSHRAHPRSCGENRTSAANMHVIEGSSPLTRGKLHAVCGELRRDGLIPAHAGKTGCPRRTWGREPAHPRSCGENVTGGPYSQSSTGSSPLMRGKLRSTRADAAASGLIPAHAGKTWPCLAA